MKLFHKTTLACTLAIIFTQSHASNCGNTNGSSYIDIPSGYTKVGEKNGICMFQKNNITVHIVDISAGAKIDFGYDGPKSYAILNNGYFAKLYQPGSIYTHFSNSRNNNSKVRTVVNSQFFGFKNGYMFMSFPVKNSSNNYISYGPDMRIPSEKSNSDYKILKYHSGEVSVGSYSNYAIQNSNGKSIVGYNKNYRGQDVNCRARIGRTYIGVQERSYNYAGTYEPDSLLVFNATRKTCNNMENIISEWGISSNNIVMFDGSGSSQFRSTIGNKTQTGDGRSLPMVLELISYGYISCKNLSRVERFFFINLYISG